MSSQASGVLVVGGRGFVGSHVVRALIATGARPQLFGPAMAEDRLADLAGAFDETRLRSRSRDRLRAGACGIAGAFRGLLRGARGGQARPDAVG